jgi:hypothetical protein
MIDTDVTATVTDFIPPVLYYCNIRSRECAGAGGRRQRRLFVGNPPPDLMRTRRTSWKTLGICTHVGVVMLLSYAELLVCCLHSLHSSFVLHPFTSFIIWTSSIVHSSILHIVERTRTLARRSPSSLVVVGNDALLAARRGAHLDVAAQADIESIT